MINRLVRGVVRPFCLDFTFELRELSRLDLGQYVQPFQKDPRLPAKDPRKDLTLVFELHDTLLHVFYPDFKDAFIDAPARRWDQVLTFEEYQIELLLYRRPHLAALLESLSEMH
jgi:hypothetical protein